MSKACAPRASRHEDALPRCAVLFPVASLSAAETAARGDLVATVTAAAKAAGTIAAPLGPNRTTCTTAGSPGAVVVPYSTAATSAAAAALSAPVPAVATSSRTAAVAAFAGDECLLGLSGRSLCPLFLRQVGVASADHADDLVPISIPHCLQRFFDEGILVGQRADETCVQYCIRDPSDPLLMHLVICMLEVMKCGDGVAVGWNCELVELVIELLRCYLTVRVVPFFEAFKNLPRRFTSFKYGSIRLTLKSCIYKISRLVCTSDLLVRKTFLQQHCLLFQWVPYWDRSRPLVYEMGRYIQHIRFEEKLVLEFLKTPLFCF